MSNLQDIIGQDAAAEGGRDPAKYELFKALVQEQFELEAKKKETEEKVKDIGRQISALAEKRIPELAAELDISEVTLSDLGLKVTVGQTYRLTLPKLEEENGEERRAEAFEHLHDLNLDGIIKNQVIATFEKGAGEQATQLLDKLRDEGYIVAQKEDAHFQTLNAALKEAAAAAAEEGKTFALDHTKFDGFAGLRSTVKQSKK